MEYKTINNNFQIPIPEVEGIVLKNKYRQKISKRLNLIGKQFFPNYKNHGINHAVDTALFSLIISNYIGVLESDINLLIDAALLHDIGRTNDFDDKNHGRNGAQIAFSLKKNDDYYTKENLNLILALIEGHNLEMYDNQMIEKYKITDILNYKKLLQIIKDADIIDRIRLSSSPLIEFERLNYDISKRLFLYAKSKVEKKEIIVNPKLKEEMVAKIKEFMDLYRKDFTKEEFIEMKKMIICLSKTDVYSKQALKEYENSFLKYYAKIWKKGMSDFKTYKESDDFRFLVTCPTVHAENFQIKSVVSSSLITNQHIGTFNKIPIGIVLEIEEDSILGISDKDMHSLSVKPNEIVNSYHYLNSTETNKIYTKNEVMSLKTPKEIEIATIQENMKQNGNILVLGEHSVYSDILLDGGKVKMKGIIIIEPCEQIWLDEANKLANKLGLTIKKIPYLHYYQKIGLNIFNENTLGGRYSLYDICFLESILKGISNVKEDSNLFVQQIGKNFYIKSYESDDYILYKPIEQELNFIKKNDSTMITISYDGLNLFYYIDNRLISKEEMIAILEEAKYSSKSSQSKK